MGVAASYSTGQFMLMVSFLFALSRDVCKKVVRKEGLEPSEL